MPVQPFVLHLVPAGVCQNRFMGKGLRDPSLDHADATDARSIEGWEKEFEAAGRRPLEIRMRYAFVRTYKPILDDVSYRSFDTMEEYRRWCEANLPDWLGYGRV